MMQRFAEEQNISVLRAQQAGAKYCRPTPEALRIGSDLSPANVASVIIECAMPIGRFPVRDNRVHRRGAPDCVALWAGSRHHRKTSENPPAIGDRHRCPSLQTSKNLCDFDCNTFESYAATPRIRVCCANRDEAPDLSPSLVEGSRKTL